MVQIFILFTKYDENLKRTILSLKENKFNNIDLVKGIIRKTDTSKLVMDNWKKFFRKNKLFTEDIMLCEDDVICKINMNVMKKKINRKKINWVFYQKRMKAGHIDEIYTVGAQGIYIPKELIKPFVAKLLESTSSHFDRWVSRLDNIYYPRGSIDWGEEIPHKSKLHHDNLR